MKVYKVVRFFEGGRKRTIKKNLSLEEAQRHCKDPETSSSTCTTYDAKQRTKRYGSWFDGYTEQKD